MGKTTTSQKSRPTDAYRIDIRWVLGGLFVATLLTLADVGRTWYWFPHNIPVPLAIYSAAIFAVYGVWVGIGIFIGWFRRRIASSRLKNVAQLLIHGGMSAAIGMLHLSLDTILVWLMFKPIRPALSFAAVFAEKLLSWLPYEILAYWACLAVFKLFEIQGQRRGGGERRSYQKQFAVKNADETRLVDCVDVDWIESCDNYVILNTATEKLPVLDTMARLESSLDPDQFHRIHRSVIVNHRSVEALKTDDAGGLSVILKGGRSFPVSRRRRPHVRRVFAGRRAPANVTAVAIDRVR